MAAFRNVGLSVPRQDTRLLNPLRLVDKTTNTERKSIGTSVNLTALQLRFPIATVRIWQFGCRVEFNRDFFGSAAARMRFRLDGSIRSTWCR